MKKYTKIRKMKMQLLAIICLILSAGFCLASSLTLDEKVKKLDPFIQSVSMCGQWDHNNEEGSYRIIYGWLWGHTEIYVQWVADPIFFPKKGQQERRFPQVIKTATFPEFNDYESATDLENVKCLKQKDHWVITADADNGHEENPVKSKYQLVIHLYKEPGKFTLEKKTMRSLSPNKEGH